MARGRRPTDEVRRDVLGAAGDLLFDAGMAGFTIEGVAERSGASKTTIYKLWPSKGALALEGYFQRVESTLRFPDTGDIELDLSAQLLSFVHLLRDSQAGRIVAELIGHSQTDADLRSAFLENYSGPRRALAIDRLASAQAAGQLRADLDLESVIDQLWGACYHRWLVPDEPLTDEFATQLLRNLFTGIT